jgi:hypothetical protein
MLRPIFAKLLLGLAVLHGASFLSACSSDSSHQDEPAATGTLSMPLLTTAGAHTYRLEGDLYVSGPIYTYLDLSSDLLTANLPTGDYQASLYSWQLTRDDGSGNFLPVAATLVSDSYPPFSIFNGATSTLSFEFETDSLLVTVGSGSLNVKVDVHEAAPLCSPLGDDCAAGTWCAPPELTGASVGCIAEGPLAEGDACNSPLDCPANTSCFDFGAGASCIRLCNNADFDLPCSSGGTCAAQGADYGVCMPAP